MSQTKKSTAYLKSNNQKSTIICRIYVHAQNNKSNNLSNTGVKDVLTYFPCPLTAADNQHIPSNKLHLLSTFLIPYERCKEQESCCSTW